MKGLLAMMLLSLIIGSCVAFCYRQDITDFQAYTRKNLQPNLPDMEDLAP